MVPGLICPETDTDEMFVVNAHLSFTKDRTKLDLLQMLALVLRLNFLNY